MSKDILIFIKHILESIDKIENSTKNVLKEEFKKDVDIQDATIRRIEVIGEAVKNLPDSLKNKHTDVPWRDIVGTRDKMIHHYFGVDLDIVWDIAKKDLPKLKTKIKEILKGQESKKQQEQS